MKTLEEAVIDFFHKGASITKRIDGVATLKGAPVVNARKPWHVTEIGTFYDGEEAVRSILLEVADTEDLRRTGLMRRTVVPAVCGMLFRGLSGGGHFWMKDCPVPLDVAFIGGDGMISKIYSMDPDGGKKRYRYDEGDDSAVEAAEGFFKDNGIKVGFRLVTRRLSGKESANG